MDKQLTVDQVRDLLEKKINRLYEERYHAKGQIWHHIQAEISALRAVATLIDTGINGYWQ